MTHKLQTCPTSTLATNKQDPCEIQLHRFYDDLVAVLAQDKISDAELDFTHRRPSVKCEGGHEARRRSDGLNVLIETSIWMRMGTQKTKIFDEVYLQHPRD